MKILVVYYSLAGNTKSIAETIAAATKADLLELKPEKEISSKGFSKYFWGGRQVVMRLKPKLLPLTHQPNDYDLIFLGTPVWSFTFTPAIRSLLAQIKLTNKKIALFCCCDGQPGKTLANLKKELINNQILGEMVFLEPLKHQSTVNAQKAKNWTQEIISLA